VSAAPVSGALLAVAARIDDAATELRARACRIDQHTADAQWSSAAARSYYQRLGTLTSALTGCATDLDALADLFRREAARHGGHR
jgi:uncharacterized protein YukE